MGKAADRQELPQEYPSPISGSSPCPSKHRSMTRVVAGFHYDPQLPHSGVPKSYFISQMRQQVPLDSLHPASCTQREAKDPAAFDI